MMRWYVGLVSAAALLLAAAVATASYPVVFVPGTLACRVAVTVVNQTFAPGCPASGTFEASAFVGDVDAHWQACLARYLQLRHAPSGAISNLPNVTTALEYDGKVNSTGGFNSAIEQVIQNTTGRPPAVACWDWRVAADEVIRGAAEAQSFTQRFAQLVESLHNETGRKVYVVGHSNGPVLAKRAMDEQGRGWTQSKIAGFMSIAGAFGGAPVALYTLLGGAGVTFAPAAAPIPEFAGPASTWPLVYYSLPRPGVWLERAPLVTDNVTGTVYYATNLTQLFQNMGRPDLVSMYGRYRGDDSVWLQPPVVPTLAVWGAGIPTLANLSVANLSFDMLPDSSQYGAVPGDNTVSEISTASTYGWAGNVACGGYEELWLTELNSSNFQSSPYSHVGLVSAPEVLEALAAFVQREPPGCTAG